MADIRATLDHPKSGNQGRKPKGGNPGTDGTFPSLLNAQTVWVWNLGISSVRAFSGPRGTPKQVHIPSRPVLTPPRGVKIRMHDTISGRAHRRAALRVDVSQT